MLVNSNIAEGYIQAKQAILNHFRVGEKTDETANEFYLRFPVARRRIKTKKVKSRTVRIVRYLIPAALLIILGAKMWLSLQYRVNFYCFDCYGYLINARAFLLGGTELTRSQIFTFLRPPFFPYLISVIWRMTGESVDAAALVQPIFTVAGAYVLFLLLKDMFDLKTALVGCLFLLATPMMYYTDQILVHGVGMFFLLLAVYLLRLGIQRSERFLPLAGGALALATLTRYTILVFVPVFLVLLTLWVGYRKRKFPWVGFGAMVLVFLILWTPWLYFNYVNGGFYTNYARNPFASVIDSMQGQALAYYSLSNTPPWYFFVQNMPYLLTIPGCILLLIGLVNKKTFEDKARLAILLYLVAFFTFHSAIGNKDLRFSIEWTPALVAFAALGFSRIEARLPSKTKILAWMFVGLWLTATFYSTMTFSLQVAQTGNRYYGGPDEFMEIAAWVKANTRPTDRVAADFGPALDWQNDRFYYDALPIAYAEQTGVPVDNMIRSLAYRYNITYFVFATCLPPPHCNMTGFARDPDLTLVKQFPDCHIYLYHCLNCTQTP
jgi:hypothetical protein